MLEMASILQDIWRLSLTTAALTLPAISVAYFLIANSDDEDLSTRMSKVIGLGALAAIVLVICSIITFGILAFGYETEQLSLYISGGSFMIGLILLLYILVLLAGFKRDIPMPKKKG